MRQLPAVILIAVAAPASLGAQAAPARSATEIAHIFTKQKHAVKERHGVRTEKFADVRSQPVVLQDTRGYAGEYHATDHGFTLRLRVSADGSVGGDGEEPGLSGTRRRFRLSDARISEGVLRATKAYDDGESVRFQGAFLERTDRGSPTAEGTRTFGLGVPDVRVDLGGGMQLDRLFYERR